MAGSKSNTNIPLNEPELAQAALDAASAATRRPRPFHKFNIPPGGEVRVNGKRLSSGETPPAAASTEDDPFARPTKFFKAEKIVDAPHSIPFVPTPATLSQTLTEQINTIATSTDAVLPPVPAAAVQLPDPTNLPARSIYPSLTPRFTPDVPFPTSLNPHSSRQLSAFLGLPITPTGTGQPSSTSNPSQTNVFQSALATSLQLDPQRDDPPCLPPPLQRHLSSNSNQSNLGHDFMRQSSSEDAILPPPWSVNDIEGGIPLISCRSDSSQAALVAEMTQTQAMETENLHLDVRNDQPADRPLGEMPTSQPSSFSSGRRKMNLTLPIGGPNHDNVITPSGLNSLETPSSGEDNTPFPTAVLNRLPSTISPTGSSGNGQWTSWMNGILQSDRDPTEQDEQQSSVPSDDVVTSTCPPSIPTASFTPFLNDMIYTPRDGATQFSLPSPTNAGLLPLTTRGMGFDTLLRAPPTAMSSGADDQAQSTGGTENSKRPFS